MLAAREDELTRKRQENANNLNEIDGQASDLSNKIADLNELVGIYIQINLLHIEINGDLGM